MRKFLAELNRRRVVRVAIFYFIAAWPLIEIVNVFLPTFNAPDWTGKVVLIAYAAGFPVTMLLAWFYQITPEGVQMDLGTASSGAAANMIVNTSTHPPARHSAKEQPEPDPLSIAVLPLTNLSPDPDNAFFASGVHEEILGQLTKIADLKVIARTAVLCYQDTEKSPNIVAKELNVSTLLEGSVRFSNHRVRITTQLIAAATNTHLWSESYDFELNDIFSIQSDVAKNVAAAMQATISPGEIRRLDKPATVNSEAYTLFLRHRYDYGLARSQPTLAENGWIMTGIEKMHRAIRLDPNFAIGIAELGWLIWYRGQMSPLEQQGKDYDEAARLAKQALALDANCSRAYQVLQRVYFHRRNWEMWEEYAVKSLKLPDIDGSAAFNAALTLALVCHFEESSYWFDIALEKNPSFVYYWELATTNKVSGGWYQEAIEMSEKYLAAGGEKNAYHATRAYCYHRLGDDDSMRREFEAIDDYQISATFQRQFMDYVRTIMGQQKEVLETVLNLPADYTKPYRIIHYAVAAGDIDLVFLAYQATMERNGHTMITEVVSDEVRQDPRFQAVDDYMHLPKQGEHLEFPRPH